MEPSLLFQNLELEAVLFLLLQESLGLSEIRPLLADPSMLVLLASGKSERELLRKLGEKARRLAYQENDLLNAEYAEELLRQCRTFSSAGLRERRQRLIQMRRDVAAARELRHRSSSPLVGEDDSSPTSATLPRDLPLP